MVNNTKNLWIFHPHATPPTLNGLTRPYNFAVKLANKGYKTTIFTSSYLHWTGINLINDKRLFCEKKYSNIKFVYINTPSSSKGNITRIINMISYYLRLIKVTKKMIAKGEVPDIIYGSSPHPLALVASIKIAKKLLIPSVNEIRDLWPETIFAHGLIKENGILGKMLIKGEHWIYKKSDALIFLKEGDVDYLKERQWTTTQGGDIDLSKCYYINNGVDIKRFDYYKNTCKLEDPDLENNKFKVVYTGAIRPTNNVGNILDTAKLLLNNDNIIFLIYGDGNQLEMLKKRVVDEKIRNVKFKGYVEKKYIPYILSKSSVNLLNYAQNKYNWSRGNSSNKLFEYMASGKPIITTVKMGYSPIDKYKCGITVDNDSPKSLADAILKVYSMPEVDYNKLAINARKAAYLYDYNILTDKLVKVFENVLENYRGVK